ATTEVIVFEGMVEVTGLAVPGNPVVLAPGYSTRVRLGHSPEKPAPTQQLQPDLNSLYAPRQNPYSRGAPAGAPRGSESSSPQSSGPDPEGADRQEGPDRHERPDH